MREDHTDLYSVKRDRDESWKNSRETAKSQLASVRSSLLSDGHLRLTSIYLSYLAVLTIYYDEEITALLSQARTVTVSSPPPELPSARKHKSHTWRAQKSGAEMGGSIGDKRARRSLEPGEHLDGAQFREEVEADTEAMLQEGLSEKVNAAQEQRNQDEAAIQEVCIWCCRSHPRK
eukprot:1179365-Prorocentrum_minimum.AAC.9